MFRYVIVIGDPSNRSDAHAIDAVRGYLHRSSALWQSAVNRPGFYASCIDGRHGADFAIPLHDRRGVIFGKLYRSDDAADVICSDPLQSLSRSHSEDIVQSKGRSLITGFWGYYVAALHYPKKATALVIRAPASPLACFHVRCGTLNLFFSSIQDCVDLKLTPLSINWDSITTQIVGADYLTHETAINEIAELVCGEAAECTHTACTTHVYWDPRLLLKDRSPKRFPEAARAIRDGVNYSVNALSSGHSHILVNVSGGLDSSIVLSALARAPHGPSLTAINYFSRAGGDERFYARRMAQSAHCRLVELPRNDQLDLRRFDDCNLTVRPVLNFSAPDTEARSAALAHDLNATAIFNGELGDNVFGRNPGPAVLLDHFRQNGFGRRFVSVALDYAMLTNQSIWRALALTRLESLDLIHNRDFNSLRAFRSRYGVDGARSLMLASSEAEQHHSGMEARFLHPWLKESRQLAPDSRKLLFGLLTVTSTASHSPFAAPDDPQSVSPLVSQPLAEIALQIPGHLHCTAAQDRAVARAAFSDVLPAEIIDRGRGKGGPTAWAKDVVENNEKFLREFLLDGILVRRALLDRRKVEAALSPKMAKSTAMVADVFAKLYIEAWVRKVTRLETPRIGTATS
jgi:asparagine synthase (glutamine-hydrolysing)